MRHVQTSVGDNTLSCVIYVWPWASLLFLTKSSYLLAVINYQYNRR